MAVTIYQALNYSDKLVRAVEEGVFPYMKESFLSSNLYVTRISAFMPPEEGLDLHNNINNKLKLRFK